MQNRAFDPFDPSAPFFGDGKSEAAFKRSKKARQRFGKLHNASTASRGLVVMSDRKYVVARDGSFRRVRWAN